MEKLSEIGVPGPEKLAEYEKPRLDKFGTFRELTRAGGNAYHDVFVTDSNDGCLLGSSGSTCTSIMP